MITTLITLDAPIDVLESALKKAPFVSGFAEGRTPKFRRFFTTNGGDVTYARDENPETGLLETWLDIYEADGPEPSRELYWYLCETVEGRVTLFEPDSTIVVAERLMR